MPHYRKLVGEKVYLSPVAPDDVYAYTRWSNDYEVMRFFGGEQSNTHWEPDKEAHEKKMKNGNEFSIIDKETDTVIGNVSFIGEDNINRNAKIGITIGEKDYWSKGYGSDTLRLMLDFGFNVRSYNTIYLNVYEFNKRGIACYEKVGFKKQGVWRDCLIIGEKKYDCFYMDILASEYFTQQT